MVHGRLDQSRPEDGAKFLSGVSAFPRDDGFVLSCAVLTVHVCPPRL